ncbi:MAG: class I SAM-dependent methyltransferase, partial [bacterium]
TQGIAYLPDLELGHRRLLCIYICYNLSAETVKGISPQRLHPPMERISIYGNVLWRWKRCPPPKESWDDEWVNIREAVELIGDAIPRRGGTWADLGAGDGTFTRALVELLGPEDLIYAVDRNHRAVAALKRWADAEAVRVTPVLADFSKPFDLPGLGQGMLDGMLFANSLHFARNADLVLARLVTQLRPGGRVVIVEYDGRRPSPWVPHPISSARLPALAASAGLSAPVIIATRPSAFGGTLYAAMAERP